MTGTVKTVKADKGYGFIACDEGGNDLFFHCRDVAPGLAFDDRLLDRRVAFGTVKSDKGPRAVDVRAL